MVSGIENCDLNGSFHLTRGAKQGKTLEWLDRGVKVISGPFPAVKTDDAHGRTVWFKSMVGAFTGWGDALNKTEDGVTLGDDQPLPDAAVLAFVQILEEESVTIRWQKGDVFLLDNVAVQLARNACVPPRRVLASFAL